MIKRNSAHFISSARAAGINIQGSFSVEDMASIKSHLPFETVRMLKGALDKVFGVDTFGPENDLRKYLSSKEFEFENGEYVTESLDTVHFVRVKSVKNVVIKTVQDLATENLLVHLSNNRKRTLWLLICGDEGGASTKLIFQIVNSSVCHSVKHARFLGLYSGKDNREYTEAIFGPLNAQLKT